MRVPPRGKWRRPVIPPPDPPDVEWDDVGAEETVLPPLPDLGFAGVEEATEPSDTVKALGAPSGSVRSMAEWMFQLAVTQAHEAANDKTCSQERREQRVRSMLSAAARVYPEALRQEAAREIKESRRAVEDRKKNRRVSAVTEPAPEAGNVIQFRGTRA